jgi:fructose/tagatose bisphosphate aldolase
MPIVSFSDLMAAAERGRYAIGYFESWDLESLMAVADAAEAARSPVLLGFSGIYLNHPHRVVHERLSTYAAMGLDICRTLSVPCNLVFNESPDLDWVFEAINLGFGLVMFSDENLSPKSQIKQVKQVVKHAHQSSVMVEGETNPLPGIAGDLSEIPDQLRITDLRTAIEFIQKTKIDALAVNLGQAHLHGRQQVHLDLSRLTELTENTNTPLVLHGTS